MKPATPSPTPALLDRCNEIAQQEATLREGGGAASSESTFATPELQPTFAT